MIINPKPSLLSKQPYKIIQSQDSHAKTHNFLNEIMMSCHDYYLVGKFGDNCLLESIQKDFNDEWVITSDRIEYAKDSLEGNIISYYGSQIIKPFSRTEIIPEYPFTGIPIEKVMSNEQGLKYIQALLNTKDTAKEIYSNLARLSGKNVWKYQLYIERIGKIFLFA
jgi:hypothetical protein